MSDAYEKLMTLARAFVDSFNTEDVDGMMAHFDEADCVYEDPTGGIHRGRPAVRAALEPNFTGVWGKVRYDTEELIADPHKNTAVAWWTLVMTRGDKSKKLRGTDVMKFRNGKLVAKLSYVKAKQTLVL
jgi:ketosteroid isomerase-like protein